MAIRIVREKGDPVLSEVAREVRRFDMTLQRLVNDMFETMEHYNGVGLAAPQIGISKQIIVMDTGEEGEALAMINPVIVEAEGSVVDVEGCLSVPGVYGEVERAGAISVRFVDPSGQQHEIEAEGLLSRVIQHELDHLRGTLFVEKVIRFIPAEDLEEDE